MQGFSWTIDTVILSPAFYARFLLDNRYSDLDHLMSTCWFEVTGSVTDAVKS